MKILIFQHIKYETPGFIKDLMVNDGHHLTTIELDEGETIPRNLNEFDALFSMGGPMDTWMEEEHPWLKDEKEAIKEFVIEKEKPFLGFCLGCQLLGEVIGGSVTKSSPPEIGILDIKMNSSKDKDDIFFGFSDSIKALQWHSYEVTNLENNKDVTLLGSSPTTKYQIFKYKNHAYGIQCHIEIKENTVRDWGCIPEYKDALEKSLGEGALEKFDNEAKINMKKMNNYASQLYNNFFKII
tara:strand:- start:453 stop:1172 length:720 start_codon:yes stop_codon:yes gene_type:complete